MTVSCILYCCLFASADVDWEISGGPPGGDARVAALARELAASKGMALEKVRRDLALVPGKLPIRWVLRLRRPGREAGGLKAEAGWTEVGEEEVVVTIPAWRYLAFPSKARRVVIHEAVHAVMASRVGTGEAYLSIPRWFREGVALMVAGEGEGRVKGRISATLLRGGSSAGFLVGVAGPAPGSLDGGLQIYPAEGFLAVSWIERRLGRAGFRELLSRLGAGGVFKDELVRLTGLQPEGIAKATLLSSSKSISRLISKRSERLFAEAVGFLEKGRHEPADEILSALEGAEGSLAVADSVVFLYARTLVEKGLYSRATRRLESLLQDGYEVPWEPEVFEQLGRCRAGLGKAREAVALWKMVRERFPHDKAVQGRISGLLSGLKR